MTLTELLIAVSLVGVLAAVLASSIIVTPLTASSAVSDNRRAWSSSSDSATSSDCWEAATRAAAAGAVVLMPAARPAVPQPRSALTARETEIAGLIAGGATNREIAVALMISPKTVSAHVEHILTKLAAARRSPIATWAATHRRPMSTDRGTSNGL